jgi:WD40 repeat protein
MRTHRSLLAFLAGVLVAVVCAPNAHGAAPPGPRLDQHGDPLPRGALARIGTVRWHQSREISSVAFSPDGKTLASGGLDRTIRLWDATTGKEARRLTGHQHFVSWLAFSPDGKTLASAGNDRTVRLWETGTGKKVRHGKAQAVCIAFSPDGRTLASCGQRLQDRKGLAEIGLWDAATARPIRTLGALPGLVDSVVYSPDGRTLASGGPGRTVRFWEIATGGQRQLLGKDVDVAVLCDHGQGGRPAARAPRRYSVPRLLSR